MLVEHGQPVEGILQVFITVFCVLQQVLNQADIVLSSLEFHAELGAPLAGHFVLFYYFLGFLGLFARGTWADWFVCFL